MDFLLYVIFYYYIHICFVVHRFAADNIVLFCSQIKWLVKLSQIPEIPEVPSFSSEALTYLQNLIDGFGMDDALEVKKIERVTNHDVKAVEYYLKQKCQSHPEIAKVFMHIQWLFQ